MRLTKKDFLQFFFDRYIRGRVDEFTGQRHDYSADGLAVWNKNVEFLNNPRFRAAYARGMSSGHKILRPRGSNIDIHIEWRVAIACWAARHAAHLEGDFVECGVNTGMMSLAICNYLDFDSLGRDLYLFDTFDGIPAEQISETEAKAGRHHENDAWYEDCYDISKKNFAPFSRAHLIRGRVPDTLSTMKIEKVSYLSLDMNVALPERAAIEYFWPKMVTGGIVLLDDYGWRNYESQKDTHDEFAKSVDVEIFALPTGQGLLLKP